MATATSSRLLAAAAIVAVLALAGCGGAARQGREHATGTPAPFTLAAARGRACRLEDRQAAIPNS